MLRALLLILTLFTVPGCIITCGVAGVEDLYNQGKDIQANQNMDSSQPVIWKRR